MAGSGGKYVEKKKKKKSENKRVLSLLSKDELQVMTNNFTSHEFNIAL